MLLPCSFALQKLIIFCRQYASLSVGMDTGAGCHEKLTGVLPWIAYADAQDATDRKMPDATNV